MYAGSRKVYRSEIVKQSIEPTWKPFELGVADVGGLDQKLTIKCFDWDKNENKDCILTAIFIVSGTWILVFDLVKMLDLWRPRFGSVHSVVSQFLLEAARVVQGNLSYIIPEHCF